MLFTTLNPMEKRQKLRNALQNQGLLRFPGAFSPLMALLIEEQGWDGVYISGAGLAGDLGLPDIGLTTMSEVTGRGHQIARVTDLPAIIDVDTGFGEPMNLARTIQELEAMGVAGCHLEDQMNPKRCGHLDHKSLVEPGEMVKKIKAAVSARRDANFLLIARTDARAVEGLEPAMERAEMYVEAGADMIFPEALQDEQEFERFRQRITLPLMANMTEFGKSPLLTAQQLQDLGYNLVIYPVTGLRLAMKAVEEGLKELKQQGTQAPLLLRMQTRQRLYELLKYQAYAAFDTDIYNFRIK